MACSESSACIIQRGPAWSMLLYLTFDVQRSLLPHLFQVASGQWVQFAAGRQPMFYVWNMLHIASHKQLLASKYARDTGNTMDIDSDAFIAEMSFWTEICHLLLVYDSVLVYVCAQMAECGSSDAIKRRLFNHIYSRFAESDNDPVMWMNRLSSDNIQIIQRLDIQQLKETVRRWPLPAWLPPKSTSVSDDENDFDEECSALLGDDMVDASCCSEENSYGDELPTTE